MYMYMYVSPRYKAEHECDEEINGRYKKDEHGTSRDEKHNA